MRGKLEKLTGRTDVQIEYPGNGRRRRWRPAWHAGEGKKRGKTKYKENSKRSVKIKENDGIIAAKIRQNLEILPIFCIFADDLSTEVYDV